MGDITTLRAGLLGIQRGQAGLLRDAREIIRANIPGSDPSATESEPDLVKALVNLASDRNQAAMGAKVIRSFEDTLGTLLDVKV